MVGIAFAERLRRFCGKLLLSAIVFVVAAVTASRSWGDTFLPKSSPPARTIAAVPQKPLTAEERIALTCLQGLVARTQPSIVTVRSREVEEFWLAWHVAKGHIDGFDNVADWTTLVEKHRDVIKGVVVPDNALFRGTVLALNVAACEDLLVGSPELAQRLKLPVVIDLRGRFQTYAEGMAWLWETYKDRLNSGLCDFRHPALLPFCTFDYGYQWRALMFWIAGPKEENPRRDAGGGGLYRLSRDGLGRRGSVSPRASKS